MAKREAIRAAASTAFARTRHREEVNYSSEGGAGGGAAARCWERRNRTGGRMRGVGARKERGPLCQTQVDKDLERPSGEVCLSMRGWVVAEVYLDDVEAVMKAYPTKAGCDEIPPLGIYSLTY